MDVRFSGEVEVRGVDGGREFAGYHGLTRSAIECGGRVGGVCGGCVCVDGAGARLPQSAEVEVFSN